MQAADLGLDLNEEQIAAVNAGEAVIAEVLPDQEEFPVGDTNSEYQNYVYWADNTYFAPELGGELVTTIQHVPRQLIEDNQEVWHDRKTLLKRILRQLYNQAPQGTDAAAIPRNPVFAKPSVVTQFGAWDIMALDYTMEFKAQENENNNNSTLLQIAQIAVWLQTLLDDVIVGRPDLWAVSTLTLGGQFADVSAQNLAAWSDGRYPALLIRISGLTGPNSARPGHHYTVPVFFTRVPVGDPSRTLQAIYQRISTVMRLEAESEQSPKDIPVQHSTRHRIHDALVIRYMFILSDAQPARALSSIRNGAQFFHEQMHVEYEDVELRFGGKRRYEADMQLRKRYNKIAKIPWPQIIDRVRCVWDPQSTNESCLLQCCLYWKEFREAGFTSQALARRWGPVRSLARTAEIREQCLQLWHAIGLEENDKIPSSKFPALEEHVGYVFVVYDSNDSMRIVYDGLRKNGTLRYDLEHTMYLIANDEHCALMKDPEAYWRCGAGGHMFCRRCHGRHCNPNHQCTVFQCGACGEAEHGGIGDPMAPSIACPQCNVRFLENCFKHHIPGSPQCLMSWYCEGCMRKFSTRNEKRANHVCGQYFCRLCRQKSFIGHECTINVPGKKVVDDRLEQGYLICFDFETEQSTGKHVVNRVESAYVDQAEHIIHDTLNEFMTWVMEYQHGGYTFVAHNGKGFDFYFVISWLLHERVKFKPIYQGSSVVSITIPSNKIRFVDTLSFFMCPLKDLPKMFGFDNDAVAGVKGWFPHKFNVPANRNYVGPMPGLQFFYTANMKDEEYDAFMEWYEEEKDKPFDLRASMEKYAYADVEILKKATVMYHKLCNELTEFSPFSQVTMASTARRYFLNVCPVEIPILRTSYEMFIRQAFRGGATNGREVSYYFPDGWHGRYEDICSMYPWVNNCCEYPIGVPDLFGVEQKTPQEDMLTMLTTAQGLGVIQCDVEVPKDLFHPLLPSLNAETGKLEFTCHDIKEQTFTSSELRYALELGYRVTRIVKMVWWKQSTTDLFKNYIKTWFVIKSQAEGWPSWCTTDELKQEFLRLYEDKHGFALDPTKIAKNASLRTVAKLFLNSLWGKFGQNSNQPQTVIITDRQDLVDLLNNRDYTIKDIRVHNDEMIEVTYQYIVPDVAEGQDELIDMRKPRDQTYVAIAVFTTSHARIKLHRRIMQVFRAGGRVLYYDTDSVAYACKDDFPLQADKHKFLGNWCSELSGEEKIGGVFYCAGPKSYYMEIYEHGQLKRKVCKFKGIKQSHTNKLSRESFRAMIEDKAVITATVDTIARDRAQQLLTSAQLTRNIKMTYDKCEMVQCSTGVSTKPWGYTAPFPYA